MINKTAPRFFNPLKLKLVLDCDGTTVELLAGNIEEIHLKLHTYGFHGSLGFSGCDNEELDTLMTLTKPIKFTLTFESSDLKATEPLLELKGFLGTPESRRVDDANDEVKGPQTQYEASIYDNARVTWEETATRKAYVDKSMKDAIEEHKNPEITLNYDFPPIEEVKPIIAFNLEPDLSLAKSARANFYSLVHWYLHLDGGIFSLNYKENEFSILGEKVPAEGDPYKIREKWITSPYATHPPTPRHNTRISKHTPQAIDSEDKENDDGHKGVRQDFVSPEHYAHYPDLAQEEVKSPLARTLPILTFSPQHFEEDFHIDKLIPGSYIEFIADKKSWSSDHEGQVYRCCSLVFNAYKTEPPDTDKPSQVYEIDTKAIVEEEDELFIDRPHFIPPKFPFEEPGVVSSNIGDEKQSTFKLSEREKDPKRYYSVSVPLAENQHVIAPFMPNESGKKYEPYTKNQPVFLALYFRAASILRPTEHIDHVALPPGVQGCQHVLSSNGPNIYDIIKQVLEDGKKSTVSLEQSSSDIQIQSVTVKEKEILIKVETKDAKLVTIRLHSEEGHFISYADKESKHSQEILMDGKQLTLTCKNDSKTSTITLAPDTITFSCDNFIIKSKNGIFDFEDALNIKAASKINFGCPVMNAESKMKVGG